MTTPSKCPHPRAARLLPLAAALLLLAELAFFAFGWLVARVVEPAATLTGDAALGPTATLAEGEYLATVSYTAGEGGGSFTLASGVASWNGGAPLSLPKSSSGVASGWLQVSAPTTLTFGVAAGEGGSMPQVASVVISAAPAQRVAAVKLLALFALLDAALLAMVWLYRRRPPYQTLVVAAVLVGVAVFATAPLLGGHAWHGSDLGYHLRRIENIAQGLSAGQFPVRIEPGWVNGYGYAVGVFYGDALLYFPAFLRLLGLGATQAYIAYLGAINLVTVALAYHAFRAMLGGRVAALAGAVLYALAPYRLCDLYTRAALGEYTALAFLPLVALGFYRCYHPGGKKALPGWLLLALGMTGVLQSHLLSTEMTALVLVLLALCLARRTFTRPVLPRLCGAVGAFLGLNAGLLVPLFDYYLTGSFQINQPGGTQAIQQNGALLGQLFGLRADAATQGLQTELVQDMPLTPGIALWLGALLLAVLVARQVCVGRGKAGGALPPAARLGLIGLVGGCLAAWASTVLFPWDAVYGLGSMAQRLVGSLQFPWRFLGPAVLLLALATAGAVAALHPRWCKLGVAAALCAVSVVAAGQYFAGYTATAAPIDYYYGTAEPNWQMSCGHYLPTQNGPVDVYDLPAGPQWADGIQLTAYQKTGTDILLTAENTSDVEATIRLDLLYYKGYTAKDTATGQMLAVGCGKNNSATLYLPSGYSGTLRVYFAAPWYWRLAEGITLLALAGAALAAHRARRGKTGEV
ncbi:MAG: hypothetical protein PHO10_07515 [Gemmiger sp.]|nr:hypothetical protein [Gemmiger sp.]